MGNRKKIMRKISCLFALLLVSFVLTAQDKKLYNPKADAKADIQAAIAKAGKENKFILLQAGGNWCGWCIEFNRFCTADTQINSMVNRSFVLYHLNWSKENENKPIFAQYGYPQRFGFPVFIILNGKGECIHTQNSAYLEDGDKSYSKEKVLDFLKMWTPHALDSATYKN